MYMSILVETKVSQISLYFVLSFFLFSYRNYKETENNCDTFIKHVKDLGIYRQKYTTKHIHTHTYTL